MQMVFKQQGTQGTRIKMTLKQTKYGARIVIVCHEHVTFVYSKTRCEAILGFHTTVRKALGIAYCTVQL